MTASWVAAHDATASDLEPPTPSEAEAASLMVANAGTLKPADVVASLLRQPALQAEAACHGVGVDVFFPTRTAPSATSAPASTR